MKQLLINLRTLGILVKVYCHQLTDFLLVAKVFSCQNLNASLTKVCYLEKKDTLSEFKLT